MNWPSSGNTSYPPCKCGMNDWTILTSGDFECGACLRQFTLAQLQSRGRSVYAPVQTFFVPQSYAPVQTFFVPQSISQVLLDDDDDPLTPTKPPPPSNERCTQCTREMSKTMDAYYGKNPYEAKKCRPCRTNKPF